MGAITAELVETGDKRDARGRRVATRERRAQLVRAFGASGLTMAAFARREGVNYATFAGWVWKAQKTGAKNPIEFAEVRLPLPSSSMVDDTPGERLEVRLPDVSPRSSTGRWNARSKVIASDATRKTARFCPSSRLRSHRI